MRIFLLFLALMSYQVSAEINTCQPNKTIKTVCNAESQIFADITIANNASISQAILEGNIENQGFVSNIEISENANFSGGRVSGTVINKGKIENIVFVGEKIQGGELAGIIENKSQIKGEIQDVKLAPNTIS